MITSKEDLHRYMYEDREKEYLNDGSLRSWVSLHFNPRIKFIKNLRYYEFYANRPRTLFNVIMTCLFYYYHKKLSYKLGYTIYKNNFGPGLFIGHYGTIVVNKDARIGADCIINVCVNIGGNSDGVPQIGHNVYIGPGAKIFGNITIGDNVTIGANAVVNHSFPSNVVIAGVPARIIKYKESYYKE